MTCFPTSTYMHGARHLEIVQYSLATKHGVTNFVEAWIQLDGMQLDGMQLSEAPSPLQEHGWHPFLGLLHMHY
jgi:hypothetical protein